MVQQRVSDVFIFIITEDPVMLHKTVGFALLLCATSAWACVGPSNATIEAALAKDLSKYKTVSVTVNDCVAELTGRVESLRDKMAAAGRARKFDALSAVVNHIVVVTPMVDDQTLVRNVSSQLWRDRERNFNLVSFAVSAHDGEVAVSGLAYSQMQRDEALTLVASIRGVREILDYIQISPVVSLYPYLTDPHARIYGSDCAGTIRECGNMHQ
jgi:osmotically-inducible protein OsmY